MHMDMDVKKKILLAEDDLEDQNIIEDGFLEVGAGGVTHYANNGEDALAWLETAYSRKALPALVILDLNMPRLNGTQTLKAIKKDARFRHIPVYIYSTSLNPIEQDECLLMGAAGYMIKAVTFLECIKAAKFFMECCEEREV
jgi:CheY-like chemotaxis protein